MAMNETAHSYLDDFDTGKTTSKKVVARCLERISERNPSLHALSEVLAEAALAQADDIDRRKSAGQKTGRLAGLPVIIKDLVDVEGAHCKAGLDFLKDYIAEQDAELVRRLRAEDAVILGMSETDSGAFLVRTPQTTHPVAPDHVVGGSSGGSGAAMAAGFGLAAIGTDTGGSIRIPAACCSVVGFKPTYGRVPLDGVRPLAWSLDHAGPLVNSAADIAPVQAVLDPQFDNTGSAKSGPFTLGYDPDYYADAVPEVRQAFESALKLAESLGHEIRKVSLPSPESVLAFHMINLTAEAGAYHFEKFPDQWDNYPEGVRQALEIAKREPAYRYVQAERARQGAREQVAKAFEEVDFLMTPTLPILPPKKTDEMAETAKGPVPVLQAHISYTCLFDQTGHPALSLPVYLNEQGLGASLQIAGPLDRDKAVVDLAVALEEARGPLQG